MRNTLINLIHHEAKNNADIYFLTADLGYSVIENFQADCPEQCINVGISEQNMIGMAAGLALSGKKVFVYSIVPFVTMRCFEQIRVDLCYQNLDVTVVGVGGGFAYGSLAATHHAIEDIALMTALPNMKVVAFADSFEVEALFPQLLKVGGPMYMRLNRGGEKVIYGDQKTDIEYGKGIVVKDGYDVTLIATGNILENVLEAAKLLEVDGINAEVVSMPVVKPLDIELIHDRARKRKIICSIEEHNVVNGFGAQVARVVMECDKRPQKFKVFGVNDVYAKKIGKQNYLREQFGLSSEHIYSEVKKLYTK